MQFGNIDFDTERTAIRVIAKSDSDALYEIYSDAATMEYWSCPPFSSQSQAVELIESAIANFEAGNSLLLAITLKESNSMIGTLSLFNFHTESRRAEVGYILSRSVWRQGLMTEVLRALVSFCFNKLNLNRLEADIDPANQASSALLKKLGFELEGRLRQRWIVDGKVTDSEIYGVVKTNYSELGY